MTTSQPSVVVGISTFNRADVLRKSIQSALDQAHRPLRVSVIDDASTDETPTVQPEFPGVTWERWDDNRGYVRARNQIMLTAEEDYYVSLDDDAWFLVGDEIAVAVAYLEAHPEAAAVAFDIVSPDQPDLRPRGIRSSVALFIGCGHVVRLSTVKALGGYAPFPGAYGAEEKDLCLRLIDAGYEIVRFDGVHVWHDKTTTARDLPRQHRSGVCNDMVLTLRRFPGAVLPQMLGWKLISHLRFAVRRGLVRPCLEGLRDFVLASGDALRNRQPVRMASLSRYRALDKTPRPLAG
jgi:GT2 family glycosyltransferase